MQRRRGLLRRIGDALRGILTGGGPAPEEAGPPPPQIPTETPEEVVLPPAEDVTTEDTSGGCDVKYIGAHTTLFQHMSKGQKQSTIGAMKVLPRWKVGGYNQHVELSDVKCILDEIGYKDRYVILITGIAEYEYPGKEGENVITLSFPLYGPDVWESLDQQMAAGDTDDEESTGTSEDWINWLLQGYQPTGQDFQWSEVQSIDILDQYF